MLTRMRFQIILVKNNFNFVEGRKVKVDFVEMSLDSIDEPTNPDEDTLQSLYEDNTDLYTNPEQRRAQHILIEDEALQTYYLFK